MAPTTPAQHDVVDVLFELYKENTIQGRHAESQRQLVTAILMSLAAAMLAGIGALRFRFGAMPLSVLIIALGRFGRAITCKYTERFEYHAAMAQGIRRRIEELCPGAELR